MGDIHGNLTAFNQCMERSQFDSNVDTLIQLGDVADRYENTAQVVEELLKIPNLIAIRGNHDVWVMNWLLTNKIETVWVNNGGKETISSYEKLAAHRIPEHKKFFTEIQQDSYTDSQNRIFVHGGFTHPKAPKFDLIKTQCHWDRSLLEAAVIGEKLGKKPTILSGFNEIYIGHTKTLVWSTDQPINIYNLWDMDTGAGSNGRLSIMDIETKELWQSDQVGPGIL